MSRKFKQLRLPLLVLLALCTGAWFYFAPSRPGPAEAATPPAQAPVAAEAAPATPPPSALPLPPPDAPLADVGALLAARADAGDAQATCRLSIALMRCRAAATVDADEERRMEEKRAALLERDGERGIQAVESDLAALRTARQACAGLAPGLESRALHYYRAAALSGGPTALFRYASGAGFTSGNDYRYLLSPEFDQWRGEAEALMKQALERGSPQAALALGFAHATDDGLFPSLVANDPAQADAYLRLTRRVFGGSLAAFPIPLPNPSLPPADAERAEAMAADWHQAYFKGRQFDITDLMRADAQTPWLDAAGASACSDGARRDD